MAPDIDHSNGFSTVYSPRTGWVEALLHDLRYALRGIVRAPGFAGAVVATLALGIGANTAIFSVTDALLFRPPAYPRPAELVSVWSGSAGEFVGIRQHARALGSVAAYATWQMNVGDVGDEARTIRAEGAEVSQNLFATLEVVPERGRSFSAGVESSGAPREVMLSDALWRSRFGGDGAIVGATILVEGVSRTVVGVMGPEFQFPRVGTQLWIPSTLDPANAGTFWGWYKYTLIARLRRGATLAAATADLKSMVPLLRRENTVWDQGPKYGANATVTPFQATLAGPARTTLLVLLGVVFALLLMACANVANLVLVRATARNREFAVRAALGCSHGRMLRQLLTENLLLAGIGGGAGCLLAWSGVHALVAALPPQIPRTAAIVVDARVLAFAAAITVFAGLAFALLPALSVAAPDLAHGARGSSQTLEHRRLAATLTVVQLAIAVILVAGSGLLLRSFDALRHVDPGFKGDRVLAARVTLPTATYRDPARRVAFLDALLSRVESTPGAASVAAVDRPPLRGPVYGMALRVEGQYEDVRHTLPDVAHVQKVTPAYFATMGIGIVHGRAFTADDRADTPGVVIVSGAIARRFWPNEEAVGKRIGPPFDGPWMTVVGVAAEVKQDSLSGAEEATIYRPLAQDPETDLTIVARTNGDPVAFAAVLDNAVSALDRSVPVSDVRTMNDIVSASLARARFTAALLTGFALLALTLGAVGIYGVVSFSVAQRTREFGVRMALGATPGSVFGLVIARGAALAAAGVTIGVVASFGVTRALAGLLYGVTATDALTLVVAPVLLFGVAVTATVVPARRAVKSDPLASLRTE